MNTILLIDDEPQIRRFLRIGLTAQHYDVLEAETAQQGLEKAVLNAPKLIILDLGLPDMDGQQLLARVRGLLRQQGDVQVVPEVFDDGHLRVDIAQRQVSLNGAAVRLSRKEFDLLRVLLSYRGRIVTQQQFLTEVWRKGQLEDTHYLRILMARLSTRLADDPASPRYLETEPGVGYRFIL